METATPIPLTEALGDWIDPQARLRDDADFYSVGLFTPLSRLEDRQNGKFLPVYQTLQDLNVIRGQSQALAAFDPSTIGLLDTLANYIFGGAGYQYEVVSRKGIELPPKLLACLNATIELFQDSVRLSGELDREIHARTRVDGEAFIRIGFDNGKFDAELIEPVQVTEPSDTRALEDWLECCEPSSWSFGVHTPECNTASPLGYFVSYASHAGDWEYYSASELVHAKRNVTRAAKRGVSDLYPVFQDLKASAKLATNMASGAALQAAIAWIEEHPQGTTQGQVQAAALAGASASVPRYQQGGSTLRNVQQYQAGSILRPSPGKLYKPGPMGAERNAGFIEVAQFVLRKIGVRWNMPEYMISGDASNANYASALVAESPFVKAREADQNYYRVVFRDLLLKAMKLAYDADLFGLKSTAETWEQLRRVIDIDVTTPQVQSRDSLKYAQSAQILAQIGVVSPETIAIESGYDWEQEKARGAMPAMQGGLPGMPQQMQPAITESHALLDTFFAGYP